MIADPAGDAHNVYGHCIALLDQSVGPSGGVLLDLGCGHAPLAELAAERFGYQYVGLDLDLQALDDLRERGLEAHEVDLESPAIGDLLDQILGARQLAAVLVLDSLEHLRAGGPMLRAVAALLARDRALCIVSVPNVTHLDVAIKAVLGQWTYTPSGLLDRTHVRLFSHDSLTAELATAGLTRVSTFNLLMPASDQHFPVAHGALSAETPLGRFVRSLRERADPYGETNQFIWALAPTPERTPVVEQPTSLPLSAIVMTQGRRPQELRELLLCLSGQTRSDFEVLVVAHRTTPDRQMVVEKAIEDQPACFRRRTHLLLDDAESPLQSLETAVRASVGRHVAVLDEQDLVLAGWAGELIMVADQHPEKLLRVRSVTQGQEQVAVGGLPALRSTEAPRPSDIGRYSVVRHFVHDETPVSAWAFPRTAVRDLALLNDAQSPRSGQLWDFYLRTAELLGVEDLPGVLVINRVTEFRGASGLAVPEPEFDAVSEVRRMTDARPLLLPAGAGAEIRALLESEAAAHQAVAVVRAELSMAQTELAQQTQRAMRLERQVRKLRRRQRDLQRRTAPRASGWSSLLRAASTPIRLARSRMAGPRG